MDSDVMQAVDQTAKDLGLTRSAYIQFIMRNMEKQRSLELGGDATAKQAVDMVEELASIVK
jgi:hypothetical protein